MVKDVRAGVVTHDRRPPLRVDGEQHGAAHCDGPARNRREVAHVPVLDLAVAHVDFERVGGVGDAARVEDLATLLGVETRVVKDKPHHHIVLVVRHCYRVNKRAATLNGENFGRNTRREGKFARFRNIVDVLCRRVRVGNFAGAQLGN